MCNGYRAIFMPGQALSAGMVDLFVTSSLVSSVSVTGRSPAAGEDVEADVAAAFGPFVVLFGEHGGDQADKRSRSGNMPTTSLRRRTYR
jgi:hypothetical protein